MMRSDLDSLAAHITDYSSTQRLFRELCIDFEVAIESYASSAIGPVGEEIAVDIARLGPNNAARVIFVVSGTHGLEGLAGSLCQTSWLRSRPALPNDTAVVLVHLLNPWGCAWRRRQTEDNVDLNRNFLDFTLPLPQNPYYDELKTALHCPELEGPLKQAAAERIQQYRALKGERAYATALFQGQHSDPSGIGFGGHNATWSNEVFTRIIKTHAVHAQQVVLIDIHSGLGPYGHGLLITPSSVGSKGIALAKAWYGQDIAAIRERPDDIPYQVQGDLCSAIEALLPHATTVSVALEYGTYDIDRLLSLQIDDCWLLNHGDACSPQGQAIRKALQDFFYPDDPAWRSMVISRFNGVMASTIAGLHGLQGT